MKEAFRTEPLLVSKACDRCRKEEKALLNFARAGWIKHKTPDGIDMLFCSLTCFEAFTCTEPTPE